MLREFSACRRRLRRACAAQMADLQARCEAHIPEMLGGEGVLEQALQYAHGHAEAGAACLAALLRESLP